MRGTGRQDPRPLSDKPFIKESICNLITFLANNGFDHPISPRILHRPSTRDVNNVATFLIRRIDPNFSPSGKFEEEVIKIFKTVHYPFTIRKAGLSLNFFFQLIFIFSF